MLSKSSESGLPYSNTGNVGVWLVILGATITQRVGMPGCTIVVTESHDLGLKYILCIRCLFPENNEVGFFGSLAGVTML